MFFVIFTKTLAQCPEINVTNTFCEMTIEIIGDGGFYYKIVDDFGNPDLSNVYYLGNEGTYVLNEDAAFLCWWETQEIGIGYYDPTQPADEYGNTVYWCEYFDGPFCQPLAESEINFIETDDCGIYNVSAVTNYDGPADVWCHLDDPYLPYEISIEAMDEEWGMPIPLNFSWIDDNTIEIEDNPDYSDYVLYITAWEPVNDYYVTSFVDISNCELPIFGCTDITACNYNSMATLDDETCEFPPANDLFENALLIELGDSIFVDNENACHVEDYQLYCSGGSNENMAVWYKFFANDSEQMLAIYTSEWESEGLKDTKIGLFDSSGELLLCEDDVDGDFPFTTLPFAGLLVPCGLLTEGQEYYIMVDNHGSQPANCKLTINDQILIPENDSFSGAIPIQLGDEIIANNWFTCHNEGYELECISSDSEHASLWYSFIAPVFDSSTSFEIFTSQFVSNGFEDTQLGIFDLEGNILQCNGDASGSSNTSAPYSSILLDCEILVPGETYYVQLDGPAYDIGVCMLSFEEIDLSSECNLMHGCTDPEACNYDSLATVDDGSCGFPPANDLFGNAIQIYPNDTILVDNTNACVNEGFEMDCAFANDPVTNSVWYKFNFSSFNPDYGHFIYTTDNDDESTVGDTQLALFNHYGELIDCDEDDDTDGLCCGHETSSSLHAVLGVNCFTLETNTDYYLMVDNWSTGSGTFFLVFAETFQPDVCWSISGCTDPSALNYDVWATSNDGSCIWEGCGLIGDANGDCSVNLLDILVISSNFGCWIDCIAGDANYDGVVNVLDILAVSTYWGNSN